MEDILDLIKFKMMFNISVWHESAMTSNYCNWQMHLHKHINMLGMKQVLIFNFLLIWTLDIWFCFCWRLRLVMIKIIRLVFVFSILCVHLTLSKPPNIVVIVADDLVRSQNQYFHSINWILPLRVGMMWVSMDQIRFQHLTSTVSPTLESSSTTTMSTLSAHLVAVLWWQVVIPFTQVRCQVPVISAVSSMCV